MNSIPTKNKNNNTALSRVVIIIILCIIIGLTTLIIASEILRFNQQDPDSPFYAAKLPNPELAEKDILYGAADYYLSDVIEQKHGLITDEDKLEIFQINSGFIVDEESRNFTPDFDSHDYIAYTTSQNSCSEKNIELDGLLIENNSASLHFSYDSTCGLCAPLDVLYLIPIEKHSLNTNFDIIISSDVRTSESCDRDVAYKPVIYLYPEEETELKISFAQPEKLRTSYPRYNDSWNVLASPDGTLTDLNTGRHFYALYWEGNNYHSEVHKDGFIVNSEEAASFLEEKLTILGLNEREANEFIIYWLPILESNEINYIHFELTDDVDEYMPLSLSVEPETKIRFIMSVKGLDEAIEVNEQDLGDTPERKGFTLVEWGGHIIH